MARSSKSSLGFKDVLRYAAGYWRRQPRKLGVILTLLTISALIETYLPTALSNFLGAIRQQQTEDQIIHALCIFLGGYLVHALISSSAYLTYNVFETYLFKQVLDDSFSWLYRLPERFFINTFAGSLISKISRARQKIETFEDRLILSMFTTSLILIGTMGFLSLRFPELAALMLVYLVFLTAISCFLVFKISGPAQGAYADAQDVFTAQLADNVTGISTTKAYAQEEYELERFYENTEALRKKNVRAYLLGNTTALIQRLLLTGMLALLLGGGTWYLFQGKATVESMAYLALAYTILQSYIRELGDNIKNLLNSSYDLHAVIDILRQEPEVAVSDNLPDMQVSKGAIDFDNITFTYPGKPDAIFSDFSVSIRAGERVALVGHSGSGKTTFVRLLQMLYGVQHGKISVDGQDVAKYSRTSLRSAISLVPQDPILFHRSLKDNIAYGKPEASMEQIREAARLAHIDVFIDHLPEKYDTLVGERGIKLSGGERQRIAIARAILADRPILILDEATSSLDSASEKAIQDALNSLTHGRTCVMIAHRLSTILDADRILVFDKGKIMEQGTHDELVARKGGIYASLFKLQSGGFITE